MIETFRRSLITGLVSLIAAPAIVRAGSLMPVKHMWVDTFARDAFSPFMSTMNDLNEASLERVLIEMRRRHPRGLRITTPRRIRT